MLNFFPFVRSPATALKPNWRFLLTTLMVAFALGLYFIISLHPFSPPKLVTMPAWVPFWPVFTLPYLGMLVVAALLPGTIQDPRRFRACVIGIVCAFIMVLPAWIFLPTELHRPPTPDGWWAAPYRWLAAIDPPRCIMPCAHGIGASVGVWFVGIERPRWRFQLGALLVIGITSIALIGQHRPIDILLGTVAAIIGIVLGETFSARRP